MTLIVHSCLLCRRYGLIGPNGCGKSTMFAAIDSKEVPIQDHIDIFYLTREMPASEKTALQCVMEVDQERTSLEKLAEVLGSQGDQGESCDCVYYLRSFNGLYV